MRLDDEGISDAAYTAHDSSAGTTLETEQRKQPRAEDRSIRPSIDEELGSFSRAIGGQHLAADDRPDDTVIALIPLAGNLHKSAGCFL